ncbi:MAG: hypothetical protein ACTSR2_14845 [Candidatus Hodarchaeales archaeon]
MVDFRLVLSLNDSQPKLATHRDETQFLHIRFFKLSYVIVRDIVELEIKDPLLFYRESSWNNTHIVSLLVKFDCTNVQLFDIIGFCYYITRFLEKFLEVLLYRVVKYTLPKTSDILYFEMGGEILDYALYKPLHILG